MSASNNNTPATQQPTMASLLLPPPPPCRNHSSSPRFTLQIFRNTRHIPFPNSIITHKFPRFKSLIVSNALAESDSNKSLAEPQTILQELANNFDLPGDYLSKLPSDLRLDLNDAAFDLSQGPVIDECGQELGVTLLNIARAWESADTSTSTSLMRKLPQLVSSLTGNNKSALGKRLVSAGRRFQAMGKYGNGELQRISKAMISTGELLSATPLSEATNKGEKEETRMFKFGDLQVELTSQKAYIGAVIGLVFGILSWELSQGVQSIPESSLQYANDNALLLAKSLRGTLLAICYSSAVLSFFASVGLILLARTLKPEEQ